MRRLSMALEQQLAEDQLVEGEEWFLVSLTWWKRVLGTSRSDESDGQTDDDSEDSDSALPRGKRACQVENDDLLEKTLSSYKRNIAVLKPMLVRAATELSRLKYRLIEGI